MERMYLKTSTFYSGPSAVNISQHVTKPAGDGRRRCRRSKVFLNTLLMMSIIFLVDQNFPNVYISLRRRRKDRSGPSTTIIKRNVFFFSSAPTEKVYLHSHCFDSSRAGLRPGLPLTSVCLRPHCLVQLCEPMQVFSCLLSRLLPGRINPKNDLFFIKKSNRFGLKRYISMEKMHTF